MPSAIRAGATRLTALTGMEKPTPEFVPLLDKIALLTPITRPCKSSSGPPELPGLIAASVWMTCGNEYRPPPSAIRSEVKVRPNPLTMPMDIEPSSPNGLPMAMTNCPTSNALESANTSGVTLAGRSSTLMTAKSLSISVPTMSAFTRSPLAKATSNRSPSLTT